MKRFVLRVNVIRQLDYVMIREKAPNDNNRIIINRAD